MKSYFDEQIAVRGRAAGLADDLSLMRDAAAGDAEAFATLFHRHRDGLQGFLFRRLRQREEAEDALTLTFYKAWRARASFRGGCPVTSGGRQDAGVPGGEAGTLGGRQDAGVPGGGPGKSWLYQIAARVALDSLRQRRPESLDLLGSEEDWTGIADDVVLDPEDCVVDAEHRRETCGAVRDAMGRLAPDDQELVRLHYFDGCDYNEIGRRIGITRSQVRGRLHRIRERMRRDLVAHQAWGSA